MRRIRWNKLDQFWARSAEWTNETSGEKEPTENKKPATRRKCGREIENVIQFSWHAPFHIELYAFEAVAVFTAAFCCNDRTK